MAIDQHRFTVTTRSLLTRDLSRVLGKNIEIRYAQGAQAFRNLPDLKTDIYDLDGKPSLTLCLCKERNFGGKLEITSNFPSNLRLTS